MRKVTFAHRLEFALLMLGVTLLRALPLPVASGMMGRLWRFVAPRLHRQKRAMAHLRLAFPEKSDKELHAITLGMWDNLGRTFAESMMADKFLKAAEKLITIPDHLQGYADQAKKTGGVIVSLHSGNWELGGVVSNMYGLDAAVTIQRIKNPLVHQYMVSRRASTFRAGIFTKGDKAGTRIMHSLHGGIVAAVMGDLRDHRGLKVPFFGHPAPTNTFPARLARQQNVPLVAVRILRLDGVRFRLDAEVLDIPHTDDIEADVRAVTIRVQEIFEDWVRDVPTQWMWAHKRWG